MICSRSHSVARRIRGGNAGRNACARCQIVAVDVDAVGMVCGNRASVGVGAHSKGNGIARLGIAAHAAGDGNAAVRFDRIHDVVVGNGIDCDGRIRTDCFVCSSGVRRNSVGFG